jgi:hypothetical protein
MRTRRQDSITTRDRRKPDASHLAQTFESIQRMPARAALHILRQPRLLERARYARRLQPRAPTHRLRCEADERDEPTEEPP